MFSIVLTFSAPNVLINLGLIGAYSVYFPFTQANSK